MPCITDHLQWVGIAVRRQTHQRDMSAVTLGLMIKLQNSLRSFQTRPATKRMLVRLVGFLPNGCKLLVFTVFWIWSFVQRIEDLCQVYTLIPSSRLMSFLGNSVRGELLLLYYLMFSFSYFACVGSYPLWLDAQTQPWVSGSIVVWSLYPHVQLE